MSRFQRAAAMQTAVLFAFVCGCAGGDGANRFAISGKVTFTGQAVPVGKILFDPDTSKKNDGPSGWADISNSSYDTRRGGRGFCGGPVVVRIEGFDGNVTADQPYGAPLFLDYQLTVDLPKQSTTKDFDVPATAAKGIRKGTPP